MESQRRAERQHVNTVRGSELGIAGSALILEELVRAPLAFRPPPLLDRSQLDAADLAGNRLGEVRELEPANSLVRRERGPAVGEDLRRARSGVKPGATTTNAFGTACRTGSGLGTTAASATAGCSSSALSSSNGLMR